MAPPNIETRYTLVARVLLSGHHFADNARDQHYLRAFLWTGVREAVAFDDANDGGIGRRLVVFGDS